MGHSMMKENPFDLFNIKDRLAIVTGGSKGIGQGIAMDLAKAGVMQLTKILALEWAKYNIMVNAIGPVYVKTPMTASWLEDPARLSAIMSRVAIKRLGDVRDLTGVLLLLASDASDYITGQTFFVDTGAMAGWPMDW